MPSRSDPDHSDPKRSDPKRDPKRAEPERSPPDRAGDGAARPPMVCIVGKKKSGKTTTVIGLVAELKRRGLRVMTIKHGHRFDLDREGTDSFRHRVDGGAERVVLAGPRQFAVLGSWPAGEEIGPAELAARHLDDADIVVVEGFKGERLPKIEVFRRAAHATPVWDPNRDDAGEYIAAVSDDPDYRGRVPFPTLAADDPALYAQLADLVVEALS